MNESDLTGAQLARLPQALGILTARMREAAAERDATPQGTARHRRAKERVTYLNGLFERLQRRMEIPVEIWSLADGWNSERGSRRGRSASSVPVHG